MVAIMSMDSKTRRGVVVPLAARPRPTTLETRSHADDASYKTRFSAPEVVRDLILVWRQSSIDG